MSRKEADEPATAVRRRTVKPEDLLDSGYVFDSAVPPDRFARLPRPDLAELRRDRTPGRSSRRRYSTSASGVARISPGYTTILCSGPGLTQHEDGGPNAFDICPMLNRTPQEEIEELEDEFARLDFDPARMS